MAGSAIGQLVTRSSDRRGSYLVPGRMGLLSVPCSVEWHCDKVQFRVLRQQAYYQVYGGCGSHQSPERAAAWLLNGSLGGQVWPCTMAGKGWNQMPGLFQVP